MLSEQFSTCFIDRRKSDATKSLHERLRRSERDPQCAYCADQPVRINQDAQELSGVIFTWRSNNTAVAAGSRCSLR
jgi:hypothetical protein